MTGVEEAQAIWKGDDKHGAINPIWNVHHARNHIQEVCFDVAVSAEKETSGGGRSGVKVFVADFGGDVRRTTTNGTVSRVSFKVPFIPPATMVIGDKSE